MKIDQLFSQDEARSQIAKTEKLHQLKNTYLNGEKIKNPNTSFFWDKKFTKKSNFLVDPMTKDRVNYAVSLMPEKTETILDIGVGQGYFIKKLQRKNHSIKIFGVDISIKGLQKVKVTTPGNYFVASVLLLPFKKRFDVISIFEVLEHIPYYDTFKTMTQIKNLLKNNGILLISVPINEKYTHKNNPNGHLRRYSKELIISELKLTGFKILAIKEFFAFKDWYNVKKLLAKFILKNKWKPNLIVIKAKLAQK